MTPFQNDEVVSARYYAGLPRLGRYLRGRIYKFFWFAFVNETLQYFVTIVKIQLVGLELKRPRRLSAKN